MSDLSPAPTPTNEQQDAREEVTTPAERDMVEAVLRAAILRHWPDADEECRSQDDTICEGFDDCLWDIANDVLTALAATRPAPLAAVSAAATASCPECGPGYRCGDDGCRHTPAAAPDEREVLDHDSLVEAVVEAIWPIGEPEGVWPRREGIYSVAERVIALAARPAPVVNGDDALREAADVWMEGDGWRVPDGVGALTPASVASWLHRRADTLTVADTPAAEPDWLPEPVDRQRIGSDWAPVDMDARAADDEGARA